MIRRLLLYLTFVLAAGASITFAGSLSNATDVLFHISRRPGSPYHFQHGAHHHKIPHAPYHALFRHGPHHPRVHRH